MRMIVATEGERVTDTNLEQKENFSLMFTSDKMEFLERSEIFVKVSCLIIVKPAGCMFPWS